jgi:RNA polymerase sigma-70 factor (ECF subfamily)
MSSAPIASRATDAELLARCRLRDQAAWNELVDRYSRYVYAILLRAFQLGEEDAREVFQEVFARTYQHLGAVRDGSALRPWIAQVTRRAAIDRLRSVRAEVLSDEPPDVAQVDAELERLAEAMLVRDALRTLPETCQEILDRCYARDESYKTIADALGLSMGTVSSRLFRCLEKLRAALRPGSAISVGEPSHG